MRRFNFSKLLGFYKLYRMMTAERGPFEIDEDFSLYIFEEDCLDDEINIKLEPNMSDSASPLYNEIKTEPLHDTTFSNDPVTNSHNTSTDNTYMQYIKIEKVDIEENELEWESEAAHEDPPIFSSDTDQDFKSSLVLNWAHLKTKLSCHLLPLSPPSCPASLEETATRNVNRLMKKTEVEDLRKIEMEKKPATPTIYIHSIEKPPNVKQDGKQTKKKKPCRGGRIKKAKTAVENVKGFRARIVEVLNPPGIMLTRQKKKELMQAFESV